MEDIGCALCRRLLSASVVQELARIAFERSLDRVTQTPYSIAASEEYELIFSGEDCPDALSNRRDQRSPTFVLRSIGRRNSSIAGHTAMPAGGKKDDICVVVAVFD